MWSSSNYLLSFLEFSYSLVLKGYMPPSLPQSILSMAPRFDTLTNPNNTMVVNGNMQLGPSSASAAAAAARAPLRDLNRSMRGIRGPLYSYIHSNLLLFIFTPRTSPFHESYLHSMYVVYYIHSNSTLHLFE